MLQPYFRQHVQQLSQKRGLQNWGMRKIRLQAIIEIFFFGGGGGGGGTIFSDKNKKRRRQDNTREPEGDTRQERHRERDTVGAIREKK